MVPGKSCVDAGMRWSSSERQLTLIPRSWLQKPFCARRAAAHSSGRVNGFQKERPKQTEKNSEETEAMQRAEENFKETVFQFQSQ